MEYRQILQSSRTGHGTAPQAIQFSPPPLISRASDGHPATLSLFFSFLSLSLTAETLDIHCLTLPPASILFHSPWLLSVTLSLLFPFLSLSLTAETLDIPCLTLPPASILFHSPGLLSATLSLLFSFLFSSLTAETLDTRWLNIPPASILFHSTWRLSATCCIVNPPKRRTPKPPSAPNYSADALIREYDEDSDLSDYSPPPSLLLSFLLLSLPAETLNTHWLILPHASILFHSPLLSATLSLLFSFPSFSLTAETLGTHWLTIPPASILFHSPWRLSATCCIVTPPEPRIPKPPNTPNRSADALIREYGEASGWESTTRSDYSSLPSPLFSFLLLSLPAEILNTHWLILPPASILFHSSWRPSAICCIVIPPSP